MREGMGNPEAAAEAGKQARVDEIKKRRAELGSSMFDWMENGVGDRETFERERRELDELDAELKKLEGKE